ncbi:hypothetical protein ACIHAX_30895 [Nocardia sp. NPDC051929]|uniref:hypothetical protein n=1 Tax=Nocardia sp. NPDC051929 TaxID=3364327 RepID=UPI0037CC47CE
MTEVMMHDIELEPEPMLGRQIDNGPLRGRFTFGWDVLGADHETVRADWLAYAKAAPNREFRQLVMVCSFRPETPESKGVFRHASLGVKLSTIPGRTANPLARLIDPGERTRPIPGPGTGMSFTVKAVVLDVGVQKPPSAAAANEEWIVRGHGASQPNPQWEFRPVKRFPLVGDHPVAALIELVPDAVNAAEVLVAAELEHRSWGVRRYRAKLGSPHAILL